MILHDGVLFIDLERWGLGGGGVGMASSEYQLFKEKLFLICNTYRVPQA